MPSIDAAQRNGDTPPSGAGKGVEQGAQGSVEQAIERDVAAGHLEADPAQRDLARRLDALAVALADVETRGGMLARWLGGRRSEAPLGLYVHGAVGRGKTMLMDLFFAAAPVAAKRRVHFHAFMAEVHARIHAWRSAKTHRGGGDDPIAPVAEAVAAEARLLCFDEFAVTDIADAMILGRLFTKLFASGVTVVTTSNVAPDDLYANGLNHALFLPFVTLLKEHMSVVRLDARTDFRLEKLGKTRTWLVPADAGAAAELGRLFKVLTGVERGAPTSVPLLGRSVAVLEAAGGVARFPFAALCEQPLGAADFLAIARAFHTVLVDDIRVMAPAERNVAKRFITMIDTFYDRHVKLLASAEAEPPGLYHADEGREVFEFERTVSRLIEMGSDDYLALPHGAAASVGTGDSTGLVET